MGLKELLEKIRRTPEIVEFDEVMQVLNDHYTYTPSPFVNGEMNNAAGENEGSCKIFAFALLHALDSEQTLACFGKYYRDDVLGEPEGSNHQNIRSFMRNGWRGIEFSRPALAAK